MCAAAWRLRTTTISLGPMPRLMGILNVTPDSFSDGGRFFSCESAVKQARQLLADGADILDVGGESTRPYSEPAPVEEELRRVAPVIEAVLREQPSAVVSVDTSKPEVARAAIHAGAQIINDVTGLTNPAMIDLARETGAGVCVMHMQGTPQTMQDDPRYDDVVAEITAFLAERRAALVGAGIDAERICLDPGVGFGKTHQHNLTLMANCRTFVELGSPVLIGHSRKGFIGKVLGDKAADRDLGTVGAALAAAAQGVQVLRVHDVKAVREALLLFSACGGIDGREMRLE